MSNVAVENILIVTIGNKDRGDDSLGPAVEEWLRGNALGDATHRVTLRSGSGEPTSLWDLWENNDDVIVVDAFHSMRHVPGTVLEYTSEQLVQSSSAAPFSTHGMGLLEAVQLGQELGKLPGRLRILGIVGQDFSPFGGLSSEVAAALPDLVKRIVAHVHTPYKETRDA